MYEYKKRMHTHTHSLHNHLERDVQIDLICDSKSHRVRLHLCKHLGGGKCDNIGGEGEDIMHVNTITI